MDWNSTMSIGGWHYCYKQDLATEKALESFKLHNPESPYFLASDGGNDFSHLTQKWDGVFYKHYQNNLGYGKAKRWEDIPTTPERIEEEVKVISEWVDRVYECMLMLKTDYVIKMEDDVLIQGKIKIPHNGDFGMCGTKTSNLYPPHVRDKFKELTGHELTPFWGAAGGVIYNSEMFLSNVDNFKYFIENHYPEMKKIHITSFACDSFVMMLYSSIGAEYKINSDLTDSGVPSHYTIVHNYKKHYSHPKEIYRSS